MAEKCFRFQASRRFVCNGRVFGSRFYFAAMLDFRIRKRSAALCDFRDDSFDACGRRIGGSGLALYPSAGIGEKIPVHGVRTYRQRCLVALAFAAFFHSRRFPVRAKLFRVRNKCFGIKLRAGGHKKNFGQRLALRFIPLHCQFFVGNLRRQRKHLGKRRRDKPFDFVLIRFNKNQRENKIQKIKFEIGLFYFFIPLFSPLNFQMFLRKRADFSFIHPMDFADEIYIVAGNENCAVVFCCENGYFHRYL